MEASTCCRAPKSASNFAPTVAANENGMNLFYMCTMYDDRVESEIIRH